MMAAHQPFRVARERRRGYGGALLGGGVPRGDVGMVLGELQELAEAETMLRETLAGEPEIVAAYTVTGDADALVQVRATDVAHLEAALERIRTNPGIARTKTIIVLSRLIAGGCTRIRAVAAIANRSAR